jgi:hypothetical protein
VSIFGSTQAGDTLTTTSPTTAKLPPSNAPTLRPSLRLNPASDAPVMRTKAPMSDLVTRTQKPAPSAPSGAPIAPSNNEEVTLSADELADRLQFAYSYCGSSLQDVQYNCSTTLKTCNADDPPCDVGQACFRNVICTTHAASSENQLPLAESSSSATLASSSPSPIAPQSLDTVLCGQACLRPLSNEECAGAGNTVFPDCLSIEVGEVCESKGECGPSLLVRNCEDQNVFLRVTPDQCSPITHNLHPPTILTSTSEPTSSPEPSAVTATLDEILADQASQADYGNIGAAWWRDVPLESASCMLSAALPLFLTVTLQVIIRRLID